MYSKFFICNTLKVVAFSALFGFSCIFNGLSPQLEAASWGKTKEVTNYENVNWTKVYCDLDEINFTADVPNYSYASLQNNDVNFNGEIDHAGYVISTSFSSNFTPPKSQDAFLKEVQDANKSYRVKAVDAKKLGAKFAVDLIPKEEGVTAYWRFLATKNRLVQLGTDDTNKNRRLYFFDGISIK
jgi:hypothetical protein